MMSDLERSIRMNCDLGFKECDQAFIHGGDEDEV